MAERPHFVIVGGGTAGWIAAFIIQDSARRRKLDLRISVVESSKIPTVGVGEATTAAFRVFLQQFGINEQEFLRKTEATFKLGIRHEDWHRKGFTYYGPIDDPHQVVNPPPGAPSDYLNVYSVSAGRPVQDMHLFGPLLERRKAPYALDRDGALVPLGPFHYAFHFDQALVGQFLKSKAQGVEIVDAVVAGVERDGESGDIRTLIMDDGTRLDGDFFIDATGFRKRLIVGELKAPWISYAHELPVNRALPFWLDIKPGDEIANYTRAWAQSSGWMWQIPTQYRYGCGYVYSDEFLTPEDAKREVETVLGREIEVRSDIRFSIGRLERPWIGNCLAVGLSSSFLEPLESTSIHGTIVQMMLFAGSYMDAPERITADARADYNTRIGRQVDDFRTFVNTHYLTERDDTPFWREVRAHRIHPETKERLAYWRAKMPRHEDFPDYLGGLPHIQTQLHYPVLDGLGLLDPAVAKAEMAENPALRAFARRTVDSLTKEYKQAATRALGHAKYLEIVRGMGVKEIAFSRQAIKTLTRMPTNTRDLIRDKVSQLASDPASLANNTKRLQGSTNRYSLRVGDWRVIFDDAGNVLFVEQVVSEVAPTDEAEMNKQLVRGPGGEQMVLLPEKEYDHLVEAAEDLADLIAMTEFDRKIELGEEEFVPERIVEQIFDGENLIRVWREYRGLSLTELASATKLLDDELAEIETDQQSPTVEQLKAIAKALKVTMDDLVR